MVEYLSDGLRHQEEVVSFRQCHHVVDDCSGRGVAGLPFPWVGEESNSRMKVFNIKEYDESTARDAITLNAQ